MPTNFSGTILPSDATFFKAINASDITSTTPVTIKAAPTNTAQAYYIKGFSATNKHATEVPMITIQEITGNVVIPAGIFFLGGKETLVVEFDQPVQLTTGEGIEGLSDASTGDTLISVWGWVGTPTATTY